MKFNENMNGWGRAAVALFWGILLVNVYFVIIAAGNGLPIAWELGVTIGSAVVSILAYNSFNKGNQTNGTLFNAVLFGLIGWGIARLINGNPSKSNET